MLSLLWPRREENVSHSELITLTLIIITKQQMILIITTRLVVDRDKPRNL